MHKKYNTSPIATSTTTSHSKHANETTIAQYIIEASLTFELGIDGWYGLDEGRKEIWHRATFHVFAREQDTSPRE